MKFLQKSFLNRYYSKNADTVQVLFLSSLFSIGLMGFRIAYTGEILFAFLVWNLFLAFLPYAISEWMSSRIQHRNKLIFFICVFVWLAFIPNAFYIITDLIHLDMNSVVPLWFDLALLLSFAWNGVLFGIISVRQMEKLFENYFSKKFGFLFILPVMVLNGFGVYVGRHLRFNSWDVIANPFQLVEDIIALFIHPIRNRFDWSMIVCYSLLLTLIYITIKRLSKVLS